MICEGTDTDGFQTASPVTRVIIRSGATVSNAADVALDFNDTTTAIEEFIIESGATVTSSSNDAIEANVPIRNFLNNGTIETAAPSSDGIQILNVILGGNLSITNNSTILVSDPTGNEAIAFALLTGSTLTFTNNGIVDASAGGEAGYEGFDQTDIVINSGSIIGADDGVRTGSGNDRIFNTGLIAVGNPAETQITDEAIEAGGGDDTVINDGIIRGLNRPAGGDTVSLDSGNDIFEIRSNGQVFGDSGTTPGIVNGEADTDTLRFGGTSPGSFVLDAIDTDYLNFEVFQVLSGEWTLTGTTTQAFTAETGATVMGTGTFGGLTFNNGSTAAPGTSIGTMIVNGNVTFDAGSTYQVEVDGSGSSDRIEATGTASVNGTVTASLLSPQPGSQEYTILTAAGGVTNNGWMLAGLSPVVEGALSFPNATDVVLGLTIDFTPDSIDLNDNQTEIAAPLSAALSAGGGDLSGVLDSLLYDIDGASAYTDALDQLSPEILAITNTATLFAAEDFTDNLFSCQARRGAEPVVREGGCFWVRPEGRVLSVDNTGDTIGFDETAVGLSAGAQFDVARDWLGGDWFAGLAAGFEAADLDMDTGASSESERYFIGASVKHQRGPWYLATAISGGFADYDTVRPLSFGGFNGRAMSSYDIAFVAGQARVAYRWEQADWYVNPLVDVNWTYLSRDDITESGGNGADLFVEGGSETFFSFSPAIEVGFDQSLDDNILSRPYARAGLSVFTDDDQALTAEFVGAPAGVSAFTTTTEFDQVFAEIEAGVVLFTGGDPIGDLGDRAVISLGYQGRISDETSQHGGFLRVALPF